MPVGGWGNAYVVRDVRTSNYSSCLFYCSDSYFDFDSSSFLLHQAEALSIEFDAPDSFNSLEDLGYYYILVILINLAAAFINVDDDFIDALNTQIANTAQKTTVYDYTDYLENLVYGSWSFTRNLLNTDGTDYGSTTVSGSGIYSLWIALLQPVSTNLTRGFLTSYSWFSSIVDGLSDVQAEINTDVGAVSSNTYATWYFLLYNVIPSLSSIEGYLSNISSYLYYNSGSVAYWCYQIYSSLHSGSTTAYSRLSSIYTTLSNVYTVLKDAEYLDYTDYLEDIYSALIYGSEAADTVSFSLASYYFGSSSVNIYIYPTAINITDSGSDVVVFYDYYSSIEDNPAYVNMRFYEEDGTYTLKTISDIESGDVAQTTLSLSFVPSYATIMVSDSEDVMTSTYTTWFSASVVYGSDVTTSNLLYEILSSLSGVSTGNSIVNVTIDTSSLENLLTYNSSSAAYWLYQIYHALVYTVSDVATASSLSTMATADDLSSGTYTNAQLIYYLFSSNSDLADSYDNLYSLLEDLYALFDTDNDDTLYETLSELAGDLLADSAFSALLTSIAEQTASSLLPVVIFNMTLALIADLTSISPVAPTLDVYIPLGDGSAYESTYDLYDLSEFLDIWKAVVLILYSLGLVQAFRSYTFKLSGGDD